MLSPSSACWYLGRPEETIALDQSYISAQSGSGRVVFIDGPMGIGKTRFVETFLGDTTRLEGATVLRACAKQELCEPLAAIVELLNDFFLNHPHALQFARLKLLGEGAAQLLPFAGPIMRDLIKGLRQPAGEIDVRRVMGPRETQTFHSAMTFLKELARDHPLVIFIDDVQWLDRSSWAFLDYSISHIQEHRFLMIAAHRSQWITNDIEEYSNVQTERLLATHLGTARLHLVRLGPYKLPEYPALMASILGERLSLTSSDCELLFQQTEGNPCFLKHLLLYLEEQGAMQSGPFGLHLHLKPLDALGPDPVLEKVLLRRIEHIYEQLPGSRKILSMASVLGETFRFQDLQRLTREDKLELLERLDKIEHRHQVIAGDRLKEQYSFDHKVTHDIVYRSAGPLLGEWHELAARYFEKTLRVHGNPLQVAAHYSRSRRPEKAARYYALAAQATADKGLHRDAAFLFARALDISKPKGRRALEARAEYQIGHAAALLHIGRFDSAIENLETLQWNTLRPEKRLLGRLTLANGLLRDARGDAITRAITLLEMELNDPVLQQQPRLRGRYLSSLATAIESCSHAGNTGLGSVLYA